jgi:hypothetical protein
MGELLLLAVTVVVGEPSSHSLRSYITLKLGPNVNCNSEIVPDPGKGVCADPVNGDAILGKGGPDPQGGNKERQLSPDKGRDRT